MIRLFATTALLTALCLPAHAVQPAKDEALAENQTYSWWLLDAIKTLDPAKNTDVEGSDVLRQLFEGLMNEDATGAMVPGMAESFTESDDRLTYTFTLREAKWSNGDPVTAGDFVYAWQRAANPETASEYAWFLELMNIVNATQVIKGEVPPADLGVTAIDDRTLQVKLTTPTPFFIKTLSHATTFPVPQKVIAEHGDAWTQPGNLVGNGAFVLTGHNLGVDLTLEKNPEYWDAANVLMTQLRAVTVNDNNVALTRYQAGELDRVQIPAGQYPRLSQEFPDQAVSTPYACSYAYVFNVSDKGPQALRDVRVRQALSLAINRDIIVDQVLQGGQRPATTWTHWAIQGFAAPDTELATIDQPAKTAKAQELLTAAGFGPDNPLSLTLQYNTDENHKKLAIAVQQFLKPLGVNLTLNNVEWKVHTDRMQAQDFDLARYAWCADYNEPTTFLDWFRTGGYNSGKWSNAEYDRLLAESKTAADPAALYTQAETILAAEVPAAFVYHYSKVDMVSPRIKGLPMQNVLNAWYAKDLYRLAD